MKTSLALLLWSVWFLYPSTADPLEPGQFVTAQGSRLMLGGQEFRFMSFNIPNLHLVEDNFAFASNNPWRWPNDFEIRDALQSIDQLGGQATRTYVLSVRREGSDMGEHVFVRGPGDFNEDAFVVLDRVLKIANEVGIRLVIPLVDNWHWWGGKGEYARFRDKTPDEFWTNEQVIQDFEQTVRFTLNRVNTLTGVAYKDDPAILGWETGNELDSPPAWTQRISALIQQLDTNHLVIDGNALHGVRQESLDDPNIDVITTHHYPNTDSDYVTAITAAHKKIAGKKPYFVGEFGFATPDKLERVMDTIIDKGISGGMLWSLRFHNRDGGFYWHSEPSGENLYKAYHWPGFPSGNAYHEKQILQTTQQKAFEIRGLDLPPPALPSPPTLLPIADVSRISWQGSTGALRYDVQRGSSSSGPWQTVGADVSDAAVQYRPLFNDSTATIGNSYHYRVIAKNNTGRSSPSNVVGPVVVAQQTLVDECRNFSLASAHSDNIKLDSLQARKTQEDVHRFSMPKDTGITYQMHGPINSWRILLFNEDARAVPTVSSSVDGKSFHLCQANTKSIPVGKGDYGYLRPLEMSGQIGHSEVRYLRIENQAHSTNLELSRIEIASGLAESKAIADEQAATRGAQLNPSILLFHKPHHTDGVSYVRGAAKLGCTKVNVVVTLLCDIDKDNKVRSFGMHKRGKYRPLDREMLLEFKAAVKEVFAEVAAQEMELSVLAHLNAGGKRYDWRNNFLFDPLSYYDGFSYQDTVIAAIEEAILATPKLREPIDISLSGEMGRSVFAHPDSYLALLKTLRTDHRLSKLNIGVSLNFNNAAGEAAVSQLQQTQTQELINQCDFVGLSNYRPVDLPVDAHQFDLAKQSFLEDMRNSGVKIPPAMPLHFSEVGIGGGTDDGPAKTPKQAAASPWNGTDKAHENPWKSPEMQQCRQDFHRALLDYLSQRPSTNPVTDAYLWSEGSWDPLDTTDKGFADPQIIKMIQTHNARQ